MPFCRAKFVVILGAVAVVALFLLESADCKSVGALLRHRRSEDASTGAKAAQIINALQRKDYESVLEKLMGKMQERQQREKIAKCMAVFKSLPICTDSTGFYVWARMQAKQIMDTPNGVATPQTK